MKKVCILFLVVLIAFAAFACGTKKTAESSDPAALVIIIGKHSNTYNIIDDVIEKITPLIKRSIVDYDESPDPDNAYYAKANVSVVVCDGDPRSVPLTKDGEDILICAANNRSNFNDEKDELIIRITDFLRSDQLVANDPEVDLLSALSRAKKLLNTYSTDLERNIVILDSGITTKGYLDMCKGETKFATNENATILENIEEGIPNLSGIKVTFYGLGCVCGRQKEITTDAMENKLIDLWQKIIEDKAKAELINDLYIYPSKGIAMEYSEDEIEGKPNYPMVSTVYFPQPDGKVIPDGITVINPTQAPTSTGNEPTPVPEPKVEAKFYSSDLGFIANTAQFLDKGHAIEAINLLSKDIEAVINETDYLIYVVGSIAKVSPDRTDRSNALSKARAEAVKNILVDEFNVPADRIRVIDAGVTEFSWRNANEDNGPKQENRVVAIFSANRTDLVDELRAEGYID